MCISAFQQQAGSIQQRFSSRIYETSPITSQTAIFMYKKSAQDASSRRDFFNIIASAGVTVAGVTAGTFAANAQTGLLPDANGGFAKPKGLGGLPKKIRSVGNIMVRSNVFHSRLSVLCVLYLHNTSSPSHLQDELQRDLMQERWDLVEKFPDQLRSYVPVFTTFTDSAFPSDAQTDKGLRVALRYEVGRFFASVERLKQATNRKSLDEAYVAYSDMSLHFDRYLHVGGLYTYYDATVTNEDYFKGVSIDSLVYSDPIKDPAEVRDLVVLAKGVDMGKTGILIGIYPDGSNKCVVKLDRFMGLREIRVVPREYVAKRLGEQIPDDVFLIPRKNEKS